MSRTYNNRNRAERFLALRHWMLSSPAWRSLTPVERALYIELAARYNGSNNGSIHYSVREAAAALHVGKSSASRAFDRLIERGFLALEKAGGFNRKTRHANEWRLTEFDSNVARSLDRKPATKEFIRWQPAPQRKFTVPVAGLTVPVVGQYGTCSGTDVARKSRYGTCSGTVEAHFAGSRSRYRYTCSLPGGATFLRAA